MKPIRTAALGAVLLAGLLPATGAQAQSTTPTGGSGQIAAPTVVVDGKWSACKKKHGGKFFKTLGCWFTPCRPSAGNLEPPGSSGNPTVYGVGVSCNF
ncbi:hypothetical protein [Patulibacter defluvii]|uniref:hypothetical protein n=1 Tax=Patulibacter defluvii TaxID=3095358 RepID=UPI002A756C32|nr:hypothetical protein [Patulibacter sp. DM4]